MTYLYENLSPEVFQQFCQALLIKTFPGMQCFPVGQPDGGRDAIFRHASQAVRSNKPFSIFQIKFVRNPQSEDQPHKRLSEILEKEALKIRKLIPSGAKHYYLLTNIPGTSHLGSGAIDGVQAILDEHIPIPATCWWRDDLDRRLDAAWDVKWSYPSLLTGQDMLFALVQSGLPEKREERTNAVTAYLADQYKYDEEVRFKQVELQNKLLDLFIDIPMSTWRMTGSVHADLALIATENGSSNWTYVDGGEEFEVFEYEDGVARVRSKPSSGAATRLLNPISKDDLRAVVEGAPGQGKSTIAQYICQVHRMRLLVVS